MPRHDSRASRSAAVMAAVALVATTGALIGAQSASAAAGCRVDYSVASQWPGGFNATAVVTNLGDPVNGWRLSWTFPGDERITQSWNGTHTQSGAQVTATNAAWNGGIATGATASFGFNATSGSRPTSPAVFTLNGTACTGSTTTTSTTTTTTTSTTTTTTTTPPTRPMIENNFSVTREGAYGDNRFTVFRPSNPQAVDRPLPVLAFGNGACAHTDNSEVTRILTFVASKGFVVVDTGSVDGSANGVPSGSPIPSLLTDAITWAEREQNRSGAVLRQRLDLTGVATAGHSCGGLEAMVAAQDRRVSGVVSLNSGFFADGSFGYPRSELGKLHTPALFMDGGSSDIAYANNQANYDLATVPAVLARHPQAGHTGFITGSQLTDGMTTVVQFLDMVLNGNETARAYVLSPSGLAAKAPWVVAKKNF
ncbi:cellulose-binding domain-containing protein [Saccharothrix texasensis]|uniref:Cellulose binding domain-containing protein n=1 Tax=Saccharothrix texasensis TaxID=103734 RepID=A0A3N1GZW9_9PSEU|nr:cellulose-binding domain-containing protein [Saccharothrix texasensis]ROP35843.1 cellulose binding domain-containing protein [Saccharothrix texasensis]